mmetsp:Transcript_21799/g.39552  ORF Transcript_21799/g.39552 Transcript_21799/m.39552 type:complete len:167 (-) Transcript_21799:553-1053(-)
MNSSSNTPTNVFTAVFGHLSFAVVQFAVFEVQCECMFAMFRDMHNPSRAWIKLVRQYVCFAEQQMGGTNQSTVSPQCLGTSSSSSKYRIYGSSCFLMGRVTTTIAMNDSAWIEEGKAPIGASSSLPKPFMFVLIILSIQSAVSKVVFPSLLYNRNGRGATKDTSPS